MLNPLRINPVLKKWDHAGDACAPLFSTAGAELTGIFIYILNRNLPGFLGIITGAEMDEALSLPRGLWTINEPNKQIGHLPFQAWLR